MKKHILDIGVAQLVGTNAALILENISYWCEHNAANNANLHDGNYWTYNSTKAFGELFPYMTVNVIRTALKKLKDNGLILTGNFNKSAYDRTTWYTLTEKAEAMLDVNVHSDEPNQEETTAENPTPSPTIAQDPWASTPNATQEQFQTHNAGPKHEPQPLFDEPQAAAQPKKPDPTEEVVNHLNLRAGTQYKPTTANTRKLIKARIKEGFTVDDMKLVIDKKCADWLNNPKMAEFLRPDTLFGNKFEGYLNARTTVQPNQTNRQYNQPTTQYVNNEPITILDAEGHLAECTRENGWF